MALAPAGPRSRRVDARFPRTTVGGRIMTARVRKVALVADAGILVVECRVPGQDRIARRGEAQTAKGGCRNGQGRGSRPAGAAGRWDSPGDPIEESPASTLPGPTRAAAAQ